MKINTTSDFARALNSGPFAWPGGYPLFFICSGGAALSFAYARENGRYVCDSIRTGANDGWRVVACDVNWEDPELYCESGCRIESAYAEDCARNSGNE